jgi:hypothetical protein
MLVLMPTHVADVVGCHLHTYVIHVALGVMTAIVADGSGSMDAHDVAWPLVMKLACLLTF